MVPIQWLKNLKVYTMKPVQTTGLWEFLVRSNGSHLFVHYGTNQPQIDPWNVISRENQHRKCLRAGKEWSWYNDQHLDRLEEFRQDLERQVQYSPLY